MPNGKVDLVLNFKMNVPCKDCKDRQVGCHSNCDKYKEYKAQLELLNKAKREEIEKRYGCKSFIGC